MDASRDGSRPAGWDALLEAESRLETRRLYRGLGLLGSLVVVTPLLGFLGTTTGLFLVGSGCSSASPGLIAAGLSEALLTTGAGLLVAIPAQLASTILRSCAQRLEGEIEEAANWLTLLARRSAKVPGAAPG